MSYQYFTNKHLTISGERLTALGYRYGYAQVTYGNLSALVARFDDEFDTLSEPQWDDLTINVLHLGKVSERDGITGIETKIRSYEKIVDPTVVTATDERNEKVTVTLS